MSPWWKAATARLEPAPDWQGAVAALEARLAAEPVRRLRLVLSNHLVRYRVLRWDKSMTRRAESEAYARHQFTELYGARAERWSFAIDRFGGGRRLAAAVDSALLEALRALAARRRVAIAAVEPLLAAAFNGERRRLRQGTFFFGVHERGRAVLLLVRDGAPERVASRRCAEPKDELARMVAAESLAGGLDSAPPLHVAMAAAA